MLSKNNIKYIQSLQHKKVRDAELAFVAEGPKTVVELLHTGVFPCRSLYALESWVSKLEPNQLKMIQPYLEVIKDFELEKISSYTSANDVVAIFSQQEVKSPLSAENMVTLVLDDIRDPGNLGTIIRTADWFGIPQIICSNHTVDRYNPKVVQSTMASLGRVNVHYTSLIPWLKSEIAVPKFAATLHGKPVAMIEGRAAAILIIGNESNGISMEVLDEADEQITIPAFGGAESLNAAVSAAILLYTVRYKRN